MMRCGLLGRNIGYSSSPEIHNSYYKLLKVPLAYEIFDVEPNNINDFIKNLKKENIIGFNVTIPYKEIIPKYINILEYPANKINAVNTVLVTDEALIGYNTDYFGFINSIKKLNISLKNKNALILGKGGSAKSIYRALVDLGCSIIDIGCRNTENIDDYFKNVNKILKLPKVEKLDVYDIIINCTPVGSMNQPNECAIDLKDLKKNSIVYDLIYRPKSTKLLDKAAELGVFTINGESMLKQQAIMAADIWIDYFKGKL